ncbi:hypothetical protein PTT03_10635 [Serratia ureilytica]
MTGWQLSDFNAYQEAYSRFGGSLCSHPDVIRCLSKEVAAPSFYVYKWKGDLVCATYVTGRTISADRNKYPFLFDDIIIPYNKNAKRIFLPFRCKQLSPYHSGDFYNCFYFEGIKRKTCIVKNEFSNLTHRKRRQAYKNFFRPVESVYLLTVFPMISFVKFTANCLRCGGGIHFNVIPGKR